MWIPFLSVRTQVKASFLIHYFPETPHLICLFRSLLCNLFKIKRFLLTDISLSVSLISSCNYCKILYSGLELKKKKSHSARTDGDILCYMMDEYWQTGWHNHRKVSTLTREILDSSFLSLLLCDHACLHAFRYILKCQLDWTPRKYFCLLSGINLI